MKVRKINKWLSYGLAVAALCSPLALGGAAVAGEPATEGVVMDKMYAVNPPGANIPGISQAMVVNDGKLMFLSGHVAINAEGAFSGSTVEEQLEQVLANIALTLKEANADFSNVARVTIYVKDYDLSMLPVIRQVRDKFVNSEKPPASALIGVASLFHPESLVEVDAIAVLN